MLNLTLADLIALRDYCHQESLGFKTASKIDEMLAKDCEIWYSRFKQVDKELSDRVEKIFENNG